MSRFRIFRVDYYDPVRIGRKNRFLYSIFGAIPSLFVIAINLGTLHSKYHNIIYLVSLLVMALTIFFLLRKIRSDINNLKTIGEIEITQSCLKKKIGDSTTEYNFQFVKELTLTKHMPGTRLRESKSGYFSYILKIEMNDGSEESMVVSDRSVDHDNKLSIAETMKTLKKIVPFEVIINT